MAAEKQGGQILHIAQRSTHPRWTARLPFAVPKIDAEINCIHLPRNQSPKCAFYSHEEHS